MPRTPEDEEFLLRRQALAPEAEPPEDLAALVPEEEDDEDSLIKAALGSPALPKPDPAIRPTQQIPTEPVSAPVRPKDPYGPGADRKALEAAIEQRKQSDVGSTFQDAASLFNKAFGGSAGDLAKADRATRDDSFNDVMRRRALTDQDAAAGKRQRDAQLDADMRDPGSDVSVRARALFSGTTVGRALRERMGDRFESLSASQLPGARDIIGSETDLLKAGLKASHSGSDDSATALEALAQLADKRQPGLGDDVRGFSGSGKQGLLAAKAHVQQALGQKFTHQENIDNRTNSYGSKTDEHVAAEADKRLGRLRSLGEQVKPELAEANVALRELERMIGDAEAKHGAGNIPGTGPFARLASQHPFLAENLQSDEANQLQQQVNIINVLKRHDITGAAFKPAEEAEIRSLVANLQSGPALKATIGRLKQLVHTALDRSYAAHPDVWRDFVSKVPDLQTENFRLDSQPGADEDSPALPTLPPEAAKARGINPAGLNTSTPVREPGGARAPVPEGKGPPPKKPGKQTMEMPDGSFIYVPPDKVEEAKARLKAKPCSL